MPNKDKPTLLQEGASGGGGVGIFGFADLANFWFGFSIPTLKLRFFSFGVLPG